METEHKRITDISNLGIGQQYWVIDSDGYVEATSVKCIESDGMFFVVTLSFGDCEYDFDPTDLGMTPAIFPTRPRHGGSREVYTSLKAAMESTNVDATPPVTLKDPTATPVFKSTRDDNMLSPSSAFDCVFDRVGQFLEFGDVELDAMDAIKKMLLGDDTPEHTRDDAIAVMHDLLLSHVDAIGGDVDNPDPTIATVAPLLVDMWMDGGLTPSDIIEQMPGFMTNSIQSVMGQDVELTDIEQFIVEMMVRESGGVVSNEMATETVSAWKVMGIAPHEMLNGPYGSYLKAILKIGDTI